VDPQAGYTVVSDTTTDTPQIDDFTHPKTGRRSLAYRINYRSMDR
jgi:phenylalanyl-tRNA synthetase alpha chain